MSEIPRNGGVYAVVYTLGGMPAFLDRGPCGDFYGVPYPISKLADWWVPESRILYFGKAGGPGIAGMLYDRVQAYSAFGLGRNVPHGGGRAIWQIQGGDQLLIHSKPTPELIPRRIEQDLIDQFVNTYGRRPFANRRR